MSRHATFRPFLMFKGVVVRHLKREMHPTPKGYGGEGGTFIRVQSSSKGIPSATSVELRYLLLNSSPTARRCLANTMLRRVCRKTGREPGINPPCPPLPLVPRTPHPSGVQPEDNERARALGRLATGPWAVQWIQGGVHHSDGQERPGGVTTSA